MNLPTASETPSSLSSPLSTPQPTTSPEPEVDMYRGVHKALRLVLAELLLRMGAASFDDPAHVERVGRDLEHALAMCDAHILHEDRHIRPALASRAPQAVEALDQEHAMHAEQVAELRALLRALGRAASAEQRRATGHTLYLHFSVFVADTLAHMAHEERVIQPLLVRLFTHDELVQIHLALVGSISPAEMTIFLRAMIPATNREERARLAADVRRSVPGHAFRGIFGALEPATAASSEGDAPAARLGHDEWRALMGDVEATP